MPDKDSILWQYLSSHQKELMADGERLFKHVEDEKLQLYDFSPLVFPYAKAYEGFLKKIFFDMGFINESVYRGTHFRIGKALNPHLEPKYRHESMYDRVVTFCGGNALADDMWNLWKKGRNLLFHYFPHNEHKIDLQTAKNIRDEILLIMARCLSECRIEVKPTT